MMLMPILLQMIEDGVDGSVINDDTQACVDKMDSESASFAGYNGVEDGTYSHSQSSHASVCYYAVILFL